LFAGEKISHFMSKRGFISRYLLIIKRLKTKPYSSFTEIRDYISDQLEYLNLTDDELAIGLSLRTFQRDIKEIRNLFGIDIQFSFIEKGYYIEQNEYENLNFQRMIESFEIFNSLNIAQNLTQYIHLEKQKPKGTENLYGILHSIKNNFKIKFSYQKFWDEIPNQRIAEPYALKEYRNRWYVIAKDLSDGIIKSFCLDRLTNLTITNLSFSYPQDFSVEEMYRYCFGIVGSNGTNPKQIILSFNPDQGKYIKSLPLHDSQIILVDNPKELRIKLRLCITTELIMEILSFGDSVKVIEPMALKNRIRNIHKRASAQ
jgi:predicted DNA-binding transcriptional regulator YafY